MINFNRIAYQIDSLGNSSSLNPISTANAPVTRVNWSCDNLPDGLTLSSSGLLSGSPATEGTFLCDVSVTTNWGTATKSIRIVIQNGS